MDDATPRPKCSGTNRQGKPCGNPRRPGSMFCTLHTEKVGARPTLDDDFISRAESELKRGLTIKDTAAILGIAERTFHEWRQRGWEDIEAEQDTVFARFALAASRAQAQARALAVDSILGASRGFTVEEFDPKTGNTRERAIPADWRAAAFYLERTDPENWRRRSDVDVTTQQGASDAVYVVPEDDRRQEVLDLLRLATDGHQDEASD